MKYVKALKGKNKVHIKYPNVENDITLCRFCTQFEPATKNDFDENPCTRCKTIKEQAEEEKKWKNFL